MNLQQGEEQPAATGDAELRRLADERAPILQQLSEGVIIADATGRLVFVNEAAERLHGVKQLDVQPDGYSDTYHLFTMDGAPYPPGDLPLARAVRNGETVEDARWRIRRPDGSEVVAIGTAKALVENGVQIGAMLTVRDDSARFDADAALRESEARFRNMADHAPVMMWVTEADGSCTYLNRAWYDFTGQTEAEALGFGWLDATHPDDKGWSGEKFLKANERREAFQLEYRLRRKDGAYRWAIDAGSPRFGPDGEFLGYIGSVIDIDERREMEDAVRFSEERYRSLVSAIGRVVWRTNADGSVVDMPDWRAITGQTVDEVRGHGWLDALHPDDRENAARLWGEALAASKPIDVDYRMRLAEGSYRWVNSRGVPVIDEAGIVQEWVGVCIDIEEQKAAERAVAMKAAEYEALAENVSQLAWMANADGHIFWYNRRWYEYTGTTPETQEGWGWESVHDPAALPAVVKRWTASLDSGTEFEMIFPLRRADGVFRPFLTRAVPIRDERGTIVRWFGTNTDVTKQLDTEKALKALNETLEHRVADEVERRTSAEDALRQAQKMEAIGQLTGGIAHDFNNLLQIIAGNLDIVKRNLPEDSARLARSVENAMRGADRAAVLTQRLLAFSRRQPLAPKVIDPNKLVSGMSELLHRTLGETYAIETVTGSGVWRVEADPNQLESALLNLAINARDAMPEGGKLTIETANTHIDRSYAEQHSGVIAGQYVVICVSDTGFGMDQDTAERAFEPFFTTKDVGKGTGLGLSMVYGFVKQSGGHLKIYSEPGAGTTVKIYLPRHHGTEAAEIVPDAERAPEAADHETVLLCEDDDDVRAFSRESLQELGYRVIEAADGETALELIASLGEEVDLLFTDVVLPGMTGAVLAERARALHPRLKVLFTTGYARNAIVHHGRLDPGVELLSKPFTYAELSARLRDLLDAPD